MPGLSGNSSSSQLAPMAEATQPCEVSPGRYHQGPGFCHPPSPCLIASPAQAGRGHGPGETKRQSPFTALSSHVRGQALQLAV